MGAWGRSWWGILLVSMASCSFDPDGLPGARPDAGVRVDAAARPDAAAGEEIDASFPDAGAVLDGCAPSAETCDGLDNDCDGEIDEGLGLGEACDGPDSDACADDLTICGPMGGVTCSAGDDDVEICNGLDDDCGDGVDEDWPVGTPCDGSDADLCATGVYACTLDGTSVSCSDDAASAVESCNTLDDDCDGLFDEDFDLAGDEQNCGACGTVCQAVNGTNPCIAGLCTPACAAGAQDCDGDPTDGCELVRDSNPACSGASYLGAVAGDATSTNLVATGGNERWYRVTVNETLLSGSGALIDLSADVTLVSPPGTDFDLYVRCAACGDGRMLSSTSTTATDSVSIGRTDASGDRSFDIFIEVRWYSSDTTACGNWTLTIEGNTASGDTTCD